jgi:hypothetical protein
VLTFQAPNDLELADYGVIAEGAQLLIDTCHTRWYCGGQNFNVNNWNVIVRADKC